MPFTDQQVQMMASGNAIIREMYQRVCKKQMEDEDRKHEEEIKAQMQSPTEAEQQKSIEELVIHNPYHDLKMQPRQHIPRDPQPFYTKFLNKRNKPNKRK